MALFDCPVDSMIDLGTALVGRNGFLEFVPGHLTSNIETDVRMLQEKSFRAADWLICAQLFVYCRNADVCC